MKITKFILLVVSILSSIKISSGQTDNKISFGEKKVIHSEILEGDREYWVHLPLDYEKSSMNYPVLYITDGDEHFCLVSGLTEFMSSQFMIPEFIIVAIFHNDRNHDLTPTHSETFVNGFQGDAAKVSGGGKKLLKFIENELMAEIESTYQASSYRVLAGHSLGGLFCVYAYLNRNDLFKGFISMDPALNWDNYVCEQTLKSLPDKSPNLINKLYISSAHNAKRNMFRKSHLSFTKKLKKKGVKNFLFEIFKDEGHLTIAYRSLYSGLKFIFSDYYIFDDPRFTAEIPFIMKFYKNLSNSYGWEVTPPENLIEMLGKYHLFDINEYAKAIEFFKLNCKNYPDSYKSFEFLATAYKKSGDIDNAILIYKKSLKLNPNNDDISKILFELESK